MPSSAIPDVKAALVAGLEGEAGLSGVRISWGAPIENYPDEIVVLADATAPQEPRYLGRLKRRESIELTVYVDVNRRTTDQAATTERAFAIAAVLESYLRNDPSLAGGDYSGSAEIVSAQFGGVSRLEEFAGDRTRRALLTVSINVDARI